MNDVRTKNTLAQLQSLPLNEKVARSSELIRQWHDAWICYEVQSKRTKGIKMMPWNTIQGEFPELKPTKRLLNIHDAAVYVSFSGGKDSTVLKHLVDSIYDDVPALFVNTGLEYPEIQKFARSQSNVVEIRPEMRFDEVIRQYGYPVITKEVSKIVPEARRALARGENGYYALKKFRGELIGPDGERSRFNCEKYANLIDAPFKISSQCCDVMKKRTAARYTKETGRVPILGNMAEESRLRYQHWVRHGCNAFSSNKAQSTPLSFWTEQDILQYLLEFNVPYCKEIYGEIKTKLVRDRKNGGKKEVLYLTGVNRTGCVYCMFGCHLDAAPNRFQRLKETHPTQYKYCIGGG